MTLDLNNFLMAAIHHAEKNELAQSLNALELAHASARDKPLWHARIHWHWLQISYKKEGFLMAARQIIPLLFAIPVSVVIMIKHLIK